MMRPMFGLAVEGAGGAVLFAALLSLLSYLGYGAQDPLELTRLAVWTAALGGFALLVAFGAAPFLLRMHPLPGRLLIGFGTGLAFTVAARLPLGLTDAALETPVLLVWPVAAALGFAGAGPRERTPAGPRVHWPFALSGLVLASSLVAAVKAPVPALERLYGAAPLEAAPAAPDDRAILDLRRTPPLVACVDSVAPPPPIDSRIDPTVQRVVVGEFADLRNAPLPGEEGYGYGYELFLWTERGQPRGVLRLTAGGLNEESGALENGRYDPRTGELRFDAHFNDGFFSRFEGRVQESRVVGVLTTYDSGCVGRSLGNDTLVLGRHPIRDSRDMGTWANDPYGFTRMAAPLWDKDAAPRRIVVPRGRYWWGVGTTAVAFSGLTYFPELRAALVEDLEAPVPGAESSGLLLQDILYAVEPLPDEQVRWVIVAPYFVASAYTQVVEAAAARTHLMGLKKDVVEVVPCCQGIALP